MASKSSPTKSIPDLEAAALRSLVGRHYKDAIAALKDLLKRERRRDWEEKLAAAYLGRAREVARKGMLQEAAMLWENHAGFQPGLAPTGEYLGWLLRAGQMAKLGRALGAVPASWLESPEGRRLLEAVALKVLEDQRLLEALPAGHAIARQEPLLKNAIAAYSDHRDEVAEGCLRQISSRSPYRNLRTLLKGLLVLERDPAEARELFGRVDADSACRGFAMALREQAETIPPDAERYLGLPTKQRVVIDRLKGYDKSRLALIRDLQAASQAKGGRRLLETVLRHRDELGETASRRFCRAALVGCPEAIPFYERAFGELSAFEQHRFKALHAEEELDYPSAGEHWGACVAELKQAPEGGQEPLTQALIHRHVARLAEQEVPDLAMDCLENSLELDPDDKASYLKLIELHEQDEDPKAGQSVLERALKRYPQDPDLLLLAMQSAQRRKAFKKVADYAKTLLHIDPINSQARRFLLEAHLGHARKQLKSKRLDAAERELAEARALDPQRRSAALLYAEGALAFMQDDHHRCGAFWREARNVAGGGVGAWFQWAMEVQGAGLSLAAAGRFAEGLEKNHVPGKVELAALVRVLSLYRGEGRQPVAQALQKLAPVLNRGFRQAELGEDDFFGLCQGLAHAAQYELLAECARQGHRRNRSAPVFGYFEIFAKCKGDAAKLLPFDQGRLHLSLDRAHQAGDRRTAALIDQFLRKYDQSLEPDFDEIFPDGFPFSEDLDEEQAHQIIERIEAFDRLTPSERARELLDDSSPEDLQHLSEKDAMGRILEKLIDILNVGGGGVLDGLPLPGGRKPKKKR